MIKHVGKVGPGDPYFCLLLPCHTRLPLRGAVGIGGAEASRRRGASWDPAPQPRLRPAGLLVRSLWERASPAERQAPDGHQRARDRGAHGAICSAPGALASGAAAGNARGLSPRPRRRLGPGKAVPATKRPSKVPCFGIRKLLAGTRPATPTRWPWCWAPVPPTASATPRGLRGPGSRAPARGLRGQPPPAHAHVLAPAALGAPAARGVPLARERERSSLSRSLELFPGLRRVRGLRCFCSKGPGFREGAPEAFLV